MKKLSKTFDSRKLSEASPLIALLAVIILFSILTDGALISASNLQAMVNKIIVTALAAIGAVFVFGAGYFDMSFGSCVCFSAVLGGMVAISTGNLVLALITIFVVSLCIGLLKGLLAAYVNVPFFIFTIVLANVISAVATVILGDSTTIYLDNAVKKIPSFNFTQMSVINLICLVAFCVLGVFLFNYTPLGVKIKNLGGNSVAARQSGIDTKRTTIIAFIFGALSIALAASLLMIRTRSVGTNTASTLSNDIMVALVLGGMPLSGGARSKISAGILGAATITVLNSGLTLLGLTVGEIQICRCIVFLAGVLIASFGYRGKMLPR